MLGGWHRAAEGTAVKEHGHEQPGFRTYAFILCIIVTAMRNLSFEKLNREMLLFFPLPWFAVIQRMKWGGDEAFPGPFQTHDKGPPYLEV